MTSRARYRTPQGHLPRPAAIEVAGTALDGAEALRLAGTLAPDLVLLDMTMPELTACRSPAALARADNPPAVIFVTAHDNFAVEAFDLDAVDYVLKPVTPERLERAVARAVARRGKRAEGGTDWLGEFWVPYRSELLRIAAADVDRIDAERDYVRLRGAAQLPCSRPCRGWSAARSRTVHPPPSLHHPAPRPDHGPAPRRTGGLVGRA